MNPSWESLHEIPHENPSDRPLIVVPRESTLVMESEERAVTEVTAVFVKVFGSGRTGGTKGCPVTVGEPPLPEDNTQT